jgi:hypothetical protein
MVEPTSVVDCQRKNNVSFLRLKVVFRKVIVTW